jgi:putative transposase
MQRTIRVKLYPSPEQVTALLDTTNQFTAVFNAVATHGWQHRIRNGVSLHHAMYYPLKAQYPALVSDLHIQARVKATEAVASALRLAKDPGRTVSQPQSARCAPRYDHHTLKVDWSAQTVKLSTTAGRQTIRFVVPAYARRFVDCAMAIADLVSRGSDWWLHIVVNVPAPEIQLIDTVIGVDLGLTQPAVTSTRRFLGERRIKAVEARHLYRRRALQKRGTRNARRRLRRLRHKQARFRRDCDHVLSKRIVASAPAGSTIVVENLTHIRQRTKHRTPKQRRRMHSWSYAQLQAFIRYKAEERGCTVVAVDPRHTSQTCSCCGYQARNNRRTRGLFHCRMCGYKLHADLNAAYNIAAKYHARSGTSRPSGLPSHSANRSVPSGVAASRLPQHAASDGRT